MNLKEVHRIGMVVNLKEEEVVNLIDLEVVRRSTSHSKTAR